jgi:cytochrome c5
MTRARPLLPFLVVVAILAACRSGTAPPATQPTDAALRERCCAQCAAAAARDPAGMDVREKTCTSYPAEWNGGPGVEDACRAWFVAQREPMRVGECDRTGAGAAP